MSNLLLVDDEPNILDSIARILRHYPFHCYTAQSGYEALNILKEVSIDVIITDLSMPLMDGLTLLKKIQIEHTDIIRLMLTGKACLTTAARAIEDGTVYKILYKPFKIEHLISEIQQAFALHKSLQRIHQQSGIFAPTSHAVMVTDIKGQIIDKNMACNLLLKMATEEKDFNFNQNIIECNDEGLLISMKNTLLRDGHWVGKIRIKDGMSRIKPVWLSSSLVKKPDGKIVSFVSALIDHAINDRKLDKSHE